MKPFAHLSPLFASACACAVMAAPAFAQTDPAAPSGDDGDIIVTARKRNERIQDVPVAITVLDATALARTGATKITDLSTAAPNVSLQNFAIFPFNLTAVIRGIGTADFEPSSDPAVALFIDGVYQPSSNGSAISLIDTESVEILRGPQGTLFGRNATAGAILIRSKRPRDTFGLEAKATVGSYGQLEGAAAVTGAIAPDLLAFRLSGAVQTLDGYFHNYNGRRLGKRDVITLRPSLLFTPSPDIDIFVVGEYARDTSQTTPGVNGLASTGGSEGADRGDYHTTTNEKADYRGIGRSITGNADYRAGFGTFTLIANYRDFKYRGNFDVDASPLTLLGVDRKERHEQKSVEGRFASSFDGPFQIVTGLTYIDHRYTLDYQGRTAALIPGLDPYSAGLPGLIVSNRQTSKTLSAYAQANFKLTDALNIDLGLNYGRETKDFDFLAAAVFFVPSTPAQISKRWSNLGPKAGINYRINPDVLLYGSYSKGFRSGGFSGRAFDQRNLGPYAPEKVDSFEIGVKSDLFERKVRLNLSAFYNKYDNLQRPFPNLVGYNGTPANPLELITFNAAGAIIKGVEAEMTVKAAEGFTINGSGAFMDASYDGFRDPAGGGSLDNLKLVYAPRWSARVNALYRRDLSASWIGEATIGYSFETAQETDTLNATVGHRKSVNLVNASLSLEQRGGPMRVTVWGRNLTRETYVVSAQAGAPVFNIFTLNEPRSFGVTAAFDF